MFCHMQLFGVVKCVCSFAYSPIHLFTDLTDIYWGPSLYPQCLFGFPGEKELCVGF